MAAGRQIAGKHGGILLQNHHHVTFRRQRGGKLTLPVWASQRDEAKHRQPWQYAGELALPPDDQRLRQRLVHDARPGAMPGGGNHHSAMAGISSSKRRGIK